MPSTSAFALIAIALCLAASSASAGHQHFGKTLFGKKKNYEKFGYYLKKKYHKCVPRVCFMLDGSASLTNYEYRLQREFVFTAAGLLDIINSNTKYSALQYGGTPAHIISKPTSAAQHFQAKVLNSYSKRYGVTSITPAMLYCISQFPGNGKYSYSPNKIVLLGDGRSNFGPIYGPFGPVTVAKLFRQKKNNDIVAVAVGNAAKYKLSQIAGGYHKVLSADAWGVLKLQGLFEPLIKRICQGYY